MPKKRSKKIRFKKKRSSKKQLKNFAEYEEKLANLVDEVDTIFAKASKKGGIKFVNTAKELTDKEQLVDTGAYKRNWTSDITMKNDEWRIHCKNPLEYASHLEEGYEIKKDYFVPFSALEGTQNAKNFVARIRAKYPNAMGFTRKAGRYKGKFIGLRSLKEAREYARKELKKLLDKAFKKK